MDEDLIGMIKWFAGRRAPRGYAICNGQMLSTIEYGALYSIIGNTFGGKEHSERFALPKLEAPIGMYIICIEGEYPVTD